MDYIDFKMLQKSIIPDNKKLLYSKNKDNFYKIAFDVFRKNDANVEEYWVLQKDPESGEDYLIAQYSDPNLDELKVKSSWSAIESKSKQNITLLYKGVPLQKFASTDYGFNTEDVNLFKDALVGKLNTDQEFRTKFLNTLSPEKRQAFSEKFPELAN